MTVRVKVRVRVKLRVRVKVIELYSAYVTTEFPRYQ